MSARPMFHSGRSCRLGERLASLLASGDRRRQIEAGVTVYRLCQTLTGIRIVFHQQN